MPENKPQLPLEILTLIGELCLYRDRERLSRCSKYFRKKLDRSLKQISLSDEDWSEIEASLDEETCPFLKIETVSFGPYSDDEAYLDEVEKISLQTDVRVNWRRLMPNVKTIEIIHDKTMEEITQPMEDIWAQREGTAIGCCIYEAIHISKAAMNTRHDCLSNMTYPNVKIKTIIAKSKIYWPMSASIRINCETFLGCDRLMGTVSHSVDVSSVQENKIFWFSNESKIEEERKIDQWMKIFLSGTSGRKGNPICNVSYSTRMNLENGIEDDDDWIRSEKALETFYTVVDPTPGLHCWISVYQDDFSEFLGKFPWHVSDDAEDMVVNDLTFEDMQEGEEVGE